MEFIFETKYNQKALTAMAKCIRKTARKARSKRSHIFGWIVFVIALLLSFYSGDEDFVITSNKIITWIVALSIFLALIFEDKLNGYFAKKRLLKGTEKVKSTFTAESFVSETEIGKSEFSYEKIIFIAETRNYFVFVFSANHAQVYDKNNLSGGTVEEFKNFICDVTKKPIIIIR